jgi:hypothetical protein
MKGYLAKKKKRKKERKSKKERNHEPRRGTGKSLSSNPRINTQKNAL